MTGNLSHEENILFHFKFLIWLLKKEKLEFNLRDDNFMEVSVNFVFDSLSLQNLDMTFLKKS